MVIRHVVQAGECLASIAFEAGFAPETIWNDAANDELRATRDSPYVLMPGDVVSIADKVRKDLPATTGARHIFRRKSVPAKLKLRLLDPKGEARAGVGYTITIDGRKQDGTTDADGRLEIWIPNHALAGMLELSSGETYPLKLGELAPVSTDAGIRARLYNLGYLDDRNAEAFNVRQAIRDFQAAAALTVTGTTDDALRDALRTAHGS